MSSLQLATQSPLPAVNVKALNYQNERVLRRLVEEGQMSHEEAVELFSDTMKFLALTGSDLKVSPPARIDFGWHNFILHTRDYADFCKSCFGHFVHHEPGSGLIGVGSRLNVDETAALAKSFFGELSLNWNNIRGDTCGSGGC